VVGSVLGILATAFAVERWACVKRRVLRHHGVVVVLLGWRHDLESITRDVTDGIPFSPRLGYPVIFKGKHENKKR